MSTWRLQPVFSNTPRTWVRMVFGEMPPSDHGFVGGEAAGDTSLGGRETSGRNQLSGSGEPKWRDVWPRSANDPPCTGVHTMESLFRNKRARAPPGGGSQSF
jgi:hypothetical protein